MFFLDLLRYIMWSLLLGGFLSFAVLLWKWLDYLYVTKTIGNFLSTVKYVTVRIYPPAVNDTSIAEMEAFLTRLSVVYSPKEPLNYYIDGAWHSAFNFEIHAKDGKIALYCKMNADHLSLFKSSLTSSFPQATIEETTDPFVNFPANFDNENGVLNYKGLVGAELSYKGGEKLIDDKSYSNDILPLKSWREFQKNESMPPVADPINQLFNVLKAVKPGVYAIIQYVAVPYGRDDAEAKVKDRWKKTFSLLKAKFAAESSYQLSEESDVRTPLVTEQEKEILNQISRKINGHIYKLKIRVAIFQDNNSSKSLFAEIMSFFESWATDVVGIGPVGKSKTWEKEGGTKFGVIGPWYSNFVNNFFWKIQGDFQRKIFYQGLITRDMSRISAGRYFSVEALSGLFHFPITNEKQPVKNQMAEMLSEGFGDSANVATGGSVPNNLPS